MKYLYWLVCAFALLAAGCSSGSPEDGRLLEIAEKVSDSPEEMLARLDSMDVASFGESDRWFHALMRIKAQDKAYIRHTSDSVILRVIDYYSRHPKSGLYPEALYYGGRVYSDIGDAPTALRYFQDALDALPENADNGFRATVLSQNGRLLNALRLYKEAALCLKQVTKLQENIGDSVKLMQNTQLLGAIYMHTEDYESADSCFMTAYSLAKIISHPDTLIQTMYMAATALYRDDILRSLQKIRKVLEKIPIRWEDMIYSYASQIYLKADIPDSAYLYSMKLIKNDNIDYQRIGYDIVLNSSLSYFSSPDSLRSYTQSYRDVIDAYLYRHDAQQAIMQTSLYNYQTHERERNNAEKTKNIYMYATVMALIVALVLCVGILYLRNRKMKLYLKYHNSLDNIEQLQNSLSLTETKLKKYRKAVEEMEAEKKVEIPKPDDKTTNSKTGDIPFAKKETEEEQLRAQLKERLLALQRAGKVTKNKPEDILDTSVFARLQEYISAEKGIDIADDIWLEVENAVLRVSPEFKSRLSMLIGGKMKIDLYHMALLVRCGFMPIHIGYMLGRSKSAMSSRRGYICEKIFGQKYGAKVMDDIINVL